MSSGELCHLHLMLNAKIAKQVSPLSRERCDRFVEKLLRAVDMERLCDMCYSDATDPGYPGQSFVQMITTSHCSLHYFSDRDEIYFDLYSCKKYDPDRVIELLRKEFHFIECNSTICERASKVGGGGTQIRTFR